MPKLLILLNFLNECRPLVSSKTSFQVDKYTLVSYVYAVDPVILISSYIPDRRESREK